ncbi:MAG TPA: hypothetical protein VFT46_11590 [Holophagaceae bacterium]|nr:hypothetical protein [Holophagaceae bacterium]
MRTASALVGLLSLAGLAACSGGGSGDGGPAAAGGPPAVPAVSLVYGVQTATLPTRYDLHTVKSDGSGERQLTGTGDALWAYAISGSKVIYDRWLRSHHHLYGVGLDGTSNVSLGSDTADVDQIYIGAAGDRAVFRTANSAEGANAWDLFSVKLDGTGLVQIGSYAYVNSGSAIEPVMEGGKVIYTDVSGGAGDLYTVNPDGTGLTPLATGPSLEAVAGEMHFLEPSSGKLVYTEFTGGHTVLHAVKLDGSGAATLTPSTVSSAVSALIPGKLLYLVPGASGTGSLWIVGLDGSGATALASDPTRLQTAGPEIGTRITVQSRAGSVREVYAMNEDGSGAVALSPLGGAYGIAGTAADRAILSTNLAPGRSQLASVALDGTGFATLTPGTELAYFQGAWGGRAVFLRNLATVSGQVQYALCASRPDGTAPTILVSHPSASVDSAQLAGDRIVFQLQDVSVSTPVGLGSVKADGTGEVRLATGNTTFMLAQ